MGRDEFGFVKHKEDRGWAMEVVANTILTIKRVHLYIEMQCCNSKHLAVYH